MRRGLRALAWLGGGLAATLLAGCGSRPDLVLVTLDTFRRDHAGAYGSGERHTPHLDALATRSRLFESALTTMPTTLPAHFSIFTGLAPRDHGLLSNYDVLPTPLAQERWLPLRLRAAGYAVAAFVTSDVFHALGLGLRGFEPFDDRGTPLRPGTDAVAAALAWLDRTKPERFFLWVHLFDAHSPYGTAADKPAGFPVDEWSYGWVDRARYEDPDARRAMAERYAAGVRDADEALGSLLAGLEARGREPLLVVTADHGELLAEELDRIGFAYGHGPILSRETLDVPLLLAGPGLAPARVGGAVSLQDLYTTILEAAGAGDPHADAEGRVDLRSDPSPARVTTAARLLLDVASRRRAGIDPAALRHMRERSIAASDGRGLLFLGEDGRVAENGAPAAADLVAAARDALAAQQRAEGARPKRDTRVNERLKALGYVE